MNKIIRSSVIVFLLLLMKPIELNAFSPAAPYPAGVVVELEPCSLQDVHDYDYIVDVLVRKSEAEDLMFSANISTTYLPYELTNGEFSDPENEWISSLLFLDIADWDNSNCSSIMFGHGEMAYYGLTEFKVVVYPLGDDPVVSTIYSVDSLVSWDSNTGFKVIYNTEEQTFIQRGYEVEMGQFDPSGFFEFLEVIVLAFFFLVIVAFVAIEAFVYMFGWHSTKSIVVSLIINSIVVLIMLVQFSGMSQATQELIMSLALLGIPALYAVKVYLVYTYDINAYKASIMISIVLYIFYFYYYFVNFI